MNRWRNKAFQSDQWFSQPHSGCWWLAAFLTLQKRKKDILLSFQKVSRIFFSLRHDVTYHSQTLIGWPDLAWCHALTKISRKAPQTLLDCPAKFVVPYIIPSTINLWLKFTKRYDIAYNAPFLPFSRPFFTVFIAISFLFGQMGAPLKVGVLGTCL